MASRPRKGLCSCSLCFHAFFPIIYVPQMFSEGLAGAKDSARWHTQDHSRRQQ